VFIGFNVASAIMPSASAAVKGKISQSRLGYGLEVAKIVFRA
jgi:hypothetical protein